MSPAIGPAERAAVLEVLESGWLAHGPKNHELERQFQELTGAPFAVAMNSCTSALQLAVEARGIRGEVIVPSFTFVASANAVRDGGRDAGAGRHRPGHALRRPRGDRGGGRHRAPRR